MNPDRTVLTDAMWARIGHMLPGKVTDPGATAADNRRARKGSPRRDLPERSRNRNSISKCFHRWASVSILKRAFNELPDEFDLDCVSVDGTILQTHRKASGAKGGSAPRASVVPGEA